MFSLGKTLFFGVLSLILLPSSSSSHPQTPITTIMPSHDFFPMFMTSVISFFGYRVNCRNLMREKRKGKLYYVSIQVTNKKSFFEPFA